MKNDKTLSEMIKLLSKLPGLGPRSARRVALHLLNNKEELMRPLMDSLEDGYRNIRHCEICGNLSTDERCHICTDTDRNTDTICVIETVSDLWAIENTSIYRGRYHILNGTLSAVEGRGPDSINIKSLMKRLESGDFRELIIATNPTIEGQTTAHYIVELLRDVEIKITKPAYGIPIGSEFNYLDESTLDIAFRNKKDF